MAPSPVKFFFSLLIGCAFGWIFLMEVGAAIKDVDIMIGEVTVNLNDELFVKKTVDTRLAASLDSSTTRKSQKKENSLQSFTKYALGFPEKVDIYPLKIYLTETMYRMMWGYLFPEEEQDSQRRQEVWKVSTTSGSKRAKKGTSVPEATAASSKPTKESEATHRIIANASSSPTVGGNQAPALGDSSKVTFSEHGNIP